MLLLFGNRRSRAKLDCGTGNEGQRHMTVDELMDRLREARGVFDAKVSAVPRERFDAAPQGRVHSPKQVVVHANAYEELITRRLRAAQEGKTTEFDRDREGWEAFNERVWAEASEADIDEVREESGRIFTELLHEVGRLTDDDLNGITELTAAIDPAWLKGQTLAEMIAIDGYEHYPMQSEALDAAGS